jgi:hypothetical protein
VVGVAVKYEVGTMSADRAREPAGAEERPDALRLPDEGLGNWCVVEQDDAAMAAGDRFQALLERGHLVARLLIEPAEERLAEIGDLGTRKAADEPLAAHDADVDPLDLDHRVRAVEDDDSRGLERRRQLAAPIRVVVVITEDRDDRDGKVAAGVGEHERLLRLPVRGQIAAEQDQVGVGLHAVEGSHRALPQGLGAMEVGCGGQPDRHFVHSTGDTPGAGSANASAGYHSPVGYTPSENLPQLIDTMKRACAALDDAGVPAMLGGGLATWARGGPPTDHDVDFYLRETDAPRALEVLEAIGMTTSTPPEGWLLKAHDDSHDESVLVDLIFRPAGGPIGDEHFQRATPMELMAQPVLVASIDDVLSTKLMALSEQEPDFRAVLEIARSLREQIDWAYVRRRTETSAFAAAFFTLVESLDIAPREVESAVAV